MKEKLDIRQVNDILAIIENGFDDQVSATGWSDFGTPMADLNGKQAFLKQVEAKLKELIK